MKRNLIIYSLEDESFIEAAGILGMVISNCKVKDVKDGLNINLSMYDSIIFLSDVKSLGKIQEYIKNATSTAKKKLYFVGIGTADGGIVNENAQSMKKAGISFEFSGFIKLAGKKDEDNKAVCSMAAEIRNMIYGKTDVLSEEEVLEAVKKYLRNNNTCALGTAADGFVRCTPIEYTYMDDVFYLITEGGMKFYGILQNKNVSLSVYDKYEGMGGNLKGLQIQGIAQIVEMKSDEYYRVMAVKGVKKEIADKLPIDMNVIKIVPSKFEFLNSDFKKSGADTKQTVVLN